MSSVALSFNNVDLIPVDNGDGQIWFASTDLARALGYSRSDKVSRIYDRRKDEFTDTMTIVSKVGVKGFGNGESEKDIRLFSLRGCHLIAMFARTKIAAEFRAWVLSLIDKHMAESKLPLSIIQSLNAVHAIRAIEFDKASGYGFGLNKWKGDKKVIDEAEAVILNHLQPQLPNIDSKEG